MFQVGRRCKMYGKNAELLPSCRMGGGGEGEA